MNTIPSRNLNPFAACWVRPGQISFRFADGNSIGHIMARLRANNWQGEIVGPHGAGKSTLLATLEPHLKMERTVFRFVVERAQRRLPSSEIVVALKIHNSLLVIDGFDELSFWQRRWLRWRIRITGSGLLVTAHSPTGLPRLATIAPTLNAVQSLVHDILHGRSHDITQEHVSASFARHEGNVREILFDLYDRHERYRRSRRTPVAARSY